MNEIKITFTKTEIHLLDMFLSYLNGELTEEQIKRIDINISYNMLTGMYNLFIKTLNEKDANKIELLHYSCFNILLKQLHINFY